MKTTVLAAAFLAVFAMPAFAEDAVKTDDGANISRIDPAATSAIGQGDMEKAAARKDYSGCMKRKSALMM
ncbi:MAG: hypothetical protein KDJ87_18515 [Rhizobiaceae bacterium]|nr:hypothetical protein [Rhizobiaceae bacterium]